MKALDTVYGTFTVPVFDNQEVPVPTPSCSLIGAKVGDIVFWVSLAAHPLSAQNTAAFFEPIITVDDHIQNIGAFSGVTFNVVLYRVIGELV